MERIVDNKHDRVAGLLDKMAQRRKIKKSKNTKMARRGPRTPTRPRRPSFEARAPQRGEKAIKINDGKETYELKRISRTGLPQKNSGTFQDRKRGVLQPETQPKKRKGPSQRKRIINGAGLNGKRQVEKNDAGDHLD